MLLRDDLGADDLHFGTIRSDSETTYDVEICEAVFRRWETVADVKRAVGE